MKKDISYFSHDEFAFYDARIELMFEKYGFAGYGRWWRILEILRGQEEFKYNLNAELAYKSLSQRLKLNLTKTKELITDFITYGLLQTDGEFFWSNSLIRRMKYLEERRLSLSERGKKGALVREGKRLAKLNDDASLVEAELKPTQAIKEKKTKEKETKENKNEDEEKQTLVTSSSSIIEESSVSKNVFISHNWETLKQRALDDDMRFVYPYVSSGKVTKPQLASWLIAFNKTLEFQAAPMKSEQDYRKHFANWFKYRDPQKEKPEDHMPMPPNKVTPTIPEKPISFMKTAKQILEEQARAREECEQRLIREEQERERQEQEKGRDAA